ncbi:hypothetical protein YC2023_122245 [Brassica napus]
MIASSNFYHVMTRSYYSYDPHLQHCQIRFGDSNLQSQSRTTAPPVSGFFFVLSMRRFRTSWRSRDVFLCDAFFSENSRQLRSQFAYPFSLGHRCYANSSSPLRSQSVRFGDSNLQSQSRTTAPPVSGFFFVLSVRRFRTSWRSRDVFLCDGINDWDSRKL